MPRTYALGNTDKDKSRLSMRDKVEREALPRASGAIRLTEYDSQRKDGFVNRLDKETTSFFFTNFPDETQVMELWTLFAKHGRVGEVYIPQKRDKRGNRFGFVKFKEVKNLEALSGRLEDVWLGSYKIRVNLSGFG
ncbi:RNA-binding protein 25-like, partial [Trifolium medium]|nr:RNA-binding protein 25-like [Trifolium medium]